MPTYVYACDTCGKQFEQFQSFKDAPLQTCPCEQCSGAVRRVFQPVGVVFKGSGWYITDSRTSTDTNTSSKTSDKGDKSDTSSETTASSETTSSDS